MRATFIGSGRRGGGGGVHGAKPPPPPAAYENVTSLFRAKFGKSIMGPPPLKNPCGRHCLLISPNLLNPRTFKLNILSEEFKRKSNISILSI